jgi:stage IV sporulation protein FB
VRGGYLTLGRWRGAPVRAHWTLPVGALVFGQGRFVPGFWLGFFLLVLVHELGHAIMVRRERQRVVSIDIHALGGVCRWAGDPTIVSGTLKGFPNPPAVVRGEPSSPAPHASIARAWIAWGGVIAQAIALVGAYAVLAAAGPPERVFTAQLAAAFTSTNIWLIAINLIPVPPLDGAEAWKLPGLLARRRRAARYDEEARKGGFEAERQMATLDRFSGEAPEAVQTAVEDALRRLGGDPKKPRN